MAPTPRPSADTPATTPTTLRLLWPQWQGATARNAAHLVPEVAPADARRGYALGTSVLQAALPTHDGPTATVPIDLDDGDEAMSTGGVESREAVLRGLEAALGLIAEHDPDRIVTLGGECSTSVAPFAHLAARHGDDLAGVWIDAHPDSDTESTAYDGYHAMAVSTILGHGPGDAVAMLPATLDPARLAMAGLHSWEDDAYENVRAWGPATFSSDDLRASSAPLLEWLAATGCTKVAIHLDVDVVDSDEVVLGLGAEPGGLRIAELRRLVADLTAAADVVGLTIAEYVPRQVLQARAMLDGFPLLG